MQTLNPKPFALMNRFAQQDKGPRGNDISRCPPFLPYTFESLPRSFGWGAFKKIMLGRFCGLRAIDLAGWGDAHTL
jgi:hypothetical protein